MVNHTFKFLHIAAKHRKDTDHKCARAIFQNEANLLNGRRLTTIVA